MNWTAETWTAIATVAIAAFTVVLAVTGGVQAWLTRKAINLAQAEFTATHRPRIKVRMITAPEPQPNESIRIRIAVVNVGESTAKIVHYRISARLHDGQEGFGVELNVGQDPESIYLTTGETYIFERISSFPWDGETWRAIGTDELQFIVIGDLAYEDGKELARNTGFARVLEARLGSYRISTIDAEDEYED
jgi:hypothetical protein